MNLRMAMIQLFAFLLVSCKEETIGHAIKRLEGDAYTRTLVRGNHRLEIRFVPETLYYLTFSGLDTNRALSQPLLDSVRTKGYLRYGLMFSLTLSPKDDTLSPLDYRNDVVFGLLAGQEDYRKTLNDFLVGLPGKVWLESGGKKHSLRTHQMVNSGGLEKSRVFTLIFDPVPDLLPNRKGPVVLVIENLVPGQGRDKIEWVLPLNRNDFI